MTNTSPDKGHTTVFKSTLMRRPFLSRESYGRGGVERSLRGTAGGDVAEAKPICPWDSVQRAMMRSAGLSEFTGRRVGVREALTPSTRHSLLAMKTHTSCRKHASCGGKSTELHHSGERVASFRAGNWHARLCVVGTDGWWHRDFATSSLRTALRAPRR